MFVTKVSDFRRDEAEIPKHIPKNLLRNFRKVGAEIRELQ